ncbi:MAG: prenyltransferase [Bacteroidales bacterium]|nr:prenyltransferase [Bacteroidales bacterium]
MMKHNIKDWLFVTRFWAFPVSAMPVLVTAAYLFSKGELSGSIWHTLLIVLLCVVGVVVLHAAGNVLSDYFDYKSGVDNPQAYAVPTLVFHLYEPKEYLVFSIILFVIGSCIGLVITSLCGPGILLIGGIGVVLTLLYSLLKYNALGDLNIFLVYGVLIILGTAYALTGSFHPEVLILSVPIGIITVSVLHANNTYDIPTDKAAGIKTFAMLLGPRNSNILYRVYMIVPFIAVALYVILGWMHPLSLLCFAGAIPAWKNYKQASSFNEKGLESMKDLDKASSQLQLVFSGALFAGLLFAGLLV